MTRIKIMQNDGTRYRLEAEGHAEDTAACNYITGVLYSLGGYLLNLAATAEAVVSHNLLEPGHAIIEAMGSRKVGVAFEMACVGLLQLQQRVPELVKVEVVERF